MITSSPSSLDGQPAPHEKIQAEAFLAKYLDTQRSSPAFATRASSARHFLHWLRLRRIPLSQVDVTVVQRFARHRCQCPGYSPREPQRPGYITNVRRFVAFLEDHGAVPVPKDLSPAAALLPAYGDHLVVLRYSRGCRSMLISGAEHFVHWLRLSRVGAQDVDDPDVERFAQHDCQCFLCRKRGTLTASGLTRRRRGGATFLQFVRERGLVPLRSVAEEDPRLGAFRAWLVHRCGVTKQTVIRYLAEAARWLGALGEDTSTYDALTIRNIILDQPASRSRKSVQLTATVLRAYLRFLAASGACRPELVQAVPHAPRRRDAALPRFISPAAIERIVTSCHAATPTGIRDLAIILLLARLGLRAGDVCQLRLTDIDWVNALLRVDGKSRRWAQLPLPQDAGDALLTYIEQVRPIVRDDRMFLRIQAPFRPLASSAEIARIVARARGRAGVEGGPSGAHVFRHSLATALVRTGSSLESIGAVLRHRSPVTTAIYAKADVTMLARVAQPWPGDDASC
ncbi:tyrosine-type recombinase/integrase [Bradyrhizobium barranii]|uniref:tyrosine-type recombinase/integrase n=1 Tax=Bradyrhizobium barranii TaxID=2992140 RepID=UPI0024B0F8E5|nr:tyrosine-type recombinase/integrase [Bradyrhizobium barranii]WFT96965.1 tyrosine-type recombinase/integrase [Bradyrhizobium barranii]